MNKNEDEYTINVMPKVSVLLSKIIMEEIAHQADLIATNAAIEAAYAEDENAGIVRAASAVRRFAEKAVAAAREIGRVKTASLNALEKAHELLLQIKKDALETAEQVKDIVEKLYGIDAETTWINEAMQHLSIFVQENVSDRKEFSSATCLQHISFFKMNQESWTEYLHKEEPVEDEALMKGRNEWSSDAVRIGCKNRYAEKSIETDNVKVSADAEKEDLDGY